MQQPTHVSYLFDPFCEWCYGASATLKRIQNLENITLELCPSGLYAETGKHPVDRHFATYSWHNCKRIEQLTGRVFSEKYRHILENSESPFDSSQAILALTAVNICEPKRALEALINIQEARFIHGLDVTKKKVLVEIMREYRFTDAIRRFVDEDNELLILNASTTIVTQNRMRNLLIQGAPHLVVTRGHHQRVINGSYLYLNTRELFDYLKYD